MEENKRPREKITLDTIIPEMPTKAEKLTPPDQDRHERETKIIEDKISRLKGQKAAMNQLIKEKQEGGRAEQQDTSKKEVLDQKRLSNKDLNDRIRYLHQQRDELNQIFQRLKYQQQKNRGMIVFKEEIKVDQTVDQLHNKLERSTLSLQEEKAIVAQISKLQKSKQYISSFQRGEANIKENKDRRSEISKELKILREQRNKTNSEMEEISKQMKINKEKFKTEIPALIEQRKQIEKKIGELIAEKKKEVDKHNKAKIAYKKQQGLIKFIERATKIKQNLIKKEQWRKRKEQEERLAELNKPHPYEKEITQIENFTKFLTRLLPNRSGKLPEENKNAFLNLEQGQLLQSKEERQASDNWFTPIRPKKQKKIREKKLEKEQREFPIMPVELLNFFSLHQIQVPSSSEQIQATIKILNAKQQEFQNKEEREEQEKNPKKKQKEEEKKRQEPNFSTNEFPEPEESSTLVSYQAFEDEVRNERGNQRARGRGNRGNRGRGYRGKNWKAREEQLKRVWVYLEFFLIRLVFRVIYQAN